MWTYSTSFGRSFLLLNLWLFSFSLSHIWNWKQREREKKLKDRKMNESIWSINQSSPWTFYGTKIKYIFSPTTEKFVRWIRTFRVILFTDWLRPLQRNFFKIRSSPKCRMMRLSPIQCPLMVCHIIVKHMVVCSI